MEEKTTCWACGEEDETIEHIVLSCSSLQLRNPVQWYHAPKNAQTPSQAFPEAQLLAEALGFEPPATGSVLSACQDRDAAAIPQSEVETRAAASPKSFGQSRKTAEITKKKKKDGRIGGEGKEQSERKPQGESEKKN
ncbi:hypothetical protein ISCGN_008074 [Ixodes scapularis]